MHTKGIEKNKRAKVVFNLESNPKRHFESVRLCANVCITVKLASAEREEADFGSIAFAEDEGSNTRPIAAVDKEEADGGSLATVKEEKGGNRSITALEVDNKPCHLKSMITAEPDEFEDKMV